MKKGLAMLLLTTMIIGLTACGSKGSENPAPENAAEETETPAEETPTEEATEENGEEKSTYKIAYVASWLGAEFFENDHAVLEPILNEAGMEIDLFGPADFDTRTETELSIIENIITGGEYDVIMLYADEPDAFVDLRLKSEEAGIPWIGYTMPASSNCGTLFIGDTYEDRAVANYNKIIEYVEAHADLYKDLDEIEVAVAGHSSNEGCDYRAHHTAELLEANKDWNFKTVYYQSAVGADEGVSFAENCLQAHPDVKIWLCNADDAAIGVYQALNNIGKGSDEDQIITGIDAGVSFRELCGAGTAFRFSSYCTSSSCAETLIEVVPKLIAGEYEYQETVSIPTTTVDINNLDVK